MADVEGIARAIATVSSSMAGENSAEHPLNLEEWQATEFEDAYLVSPAGRRSNRLYFVRGDDVVAFSPSVTSFDDAYARLRSN